MTARPTRRRLGPGAVLLTVAVLAASLVPGVAAAQSEAELDAARERAAAVDARITDAEERLADARAEVAALEGQLREAGRDLARAQAEQAEATTSAELASRRADRARADLATVETEVEDNLDVLAAFASRMYKHGTIGSSSAAMALRALSVQEPGAGLADQLQTTRHGLREQRRIVEAATVLRVRTETLAAAADAEEEAERRYLAEAVAASDRAAAAHAAVQQLVADASSAEARRADRVAELEAARRGIAAEIDELEDRIARERAERERREAAERERAAREAAEREAAERAAAERAARERSSSGGSSGSGSGGGGSGGGGSTRVTPGPASGLVTVGGITVAASLGPSLQALLDAARADGIVLGGSGYRSPDAQAALRRANGCPDVWTAPASSCRVPTAIPGSSQHEKGLAVDFTYQGRTICYPNSAARCRGNAAFDWLRANAGRYGLRNLPSEAWHWSTTGR